MLLIIKCTFFFLTDEILFLSKEDNAIPSTVKIVRQEVNENRGTLLLFYFLCVDLYYDIKSV